MSALFKSVIFFAFIYVTSYASQKLTVQTIGIFSECINAKTKNDTKWNCTESYRIAKFLNGFFAEFKYEFQLYTKSMATMFQKFRLKKLLLISLEPIKYDNFMYRELSYKSIKVNSKRIKL